MNNATYLDEMYNYLTLPDNYSSALDLAENLANVESRLRDEFWEKVTNQLKVKTEEYQNERSIHLDFTTDGSNWFQIKKDDWGFYIISTDNHEDVGLKIRDEPCDVKDQENIIRNEIEARKGFLGPYQNIRWICWKRFNNYHFQKKEEKIKILPDVRDSKISECANEIFLYIEKLIEACNIINKKMSDSINGSVI